MSASEIVKCIDARRSPLASAEAIQRLRENPHLRDEFDREYGNGMAAVYLASTDRGVGSKKNERTVRRTEQPPNTGDDAAVGPRSFGFDVEKLNAEYALVLMGSKVMIFVERAGLEEERMLEIRSFHIWHLNKFTEIVSGDGKIKRVTWSTAWLQSRNRRSYSGIEFHPDPNNASGTEGYLNLWSGFSVKPAEKPDSLRYKTFRDHLLTNVCRGDNKLFTWLFGYFAHMVQRPRERPETAVVLRGGMGFGKTKVGEVFGSLIARHYSLVDHPRYVTGNFNSHMAGCLLLQADEAVWAGDKTAEGRLKGLITAKFQQIEAKGVDSVRMLNYLRLIMTSNEMWVVPAGMDERRYAMFDVDPRCAKNFDYFREIDAELDNGGREALLADLLAFDLSSINLRQIPRTEALLEQKIRSFDSVTSWWFERLFNGRTTRHGSDWQRVVPVASLYRDYVATSEDSGIRRRQGETAMGMQLHKLVPNLDRVQRTIETEDPQQPRKRVWCYLLPALSEARAAFERRVGQPIEWPTAEENRPDIAARDDGDDLDV